MKKAYLILLLFSCVCFSQHISKIEAVVDSNKKELIVSQKITFFNQTQDTLSQIVLNDWMNAYTSKKTPMGARFSDEFDRSFYLAKEKQRGRTYDLQIQNSNLVLLDRDKQLPDVIRISLQNKLFPQQKLSISLRYKVKIPSDAFTKYGYGDEQKMYLKNCFLTVARYENHQFVTYNNLNLDDCANSVTDFELKLKIPKLLTLFSDLNVVKNEVVEDFKYYELSGKNRLDFSLFIDFKKEFSIYKNAQVEVVSDLKDARLNDIQRAISIDKIIDFTMPYLGKIPFEKIAVAQADYDRNPFYGLNQLPMYMSPFPDTFLYELKFLKTYLNNYLHQILRLDARKDAWIFDGIQVYIMMKYVEEFYPESKMVGSIASYKLFKGFNLAHVDFNSQYSYFYLLMARKNLDQPLNAPRDKLIKFNEKIASKYRAGLSFNYLDKYLRNDAVSQSIKDFVVLNQKQQTTRSDFEKILKSKTNKEIDWFFNTLIDSRKLIDFKFKNVSQSNDTIQFSILNKTNANVPISVYGVQNKKIVFKTWIDAISKDSLYKIPKLGADHLVANYENEVPEFNARNNWYSLKKIKFLNKPVKFSFMKDIEDFRYNQITYVPTFDFNIYDGALLGLRLNNRTLLDKPFNYDINPMYSTYRRDLSGKASLFFNQYNRDSNLYYIRYQMNGHYLHYTPDARYAKFEPIVTFYFRPDDYRDNTKQALMIKDVIVDKQTTNYVVSDNTESYQILNARYFYTKSETVHNFSFTTDFQWSSKFSKLAFDVQYWNYFENNRQLNVRLFAGRFLSNSASSFFDFGLDRPSDYLFESDYLGRSETKGLFSQQSIVADGFFKSKLDTRFANQWITTANIGYTIWNWIEAYADVGFVKNKWIDPEFVYDSGIRLNLVTHYFELYFPVYSKNGWEIAQNPYGEKVRFIVTFSPQSLLTLFTRKWF